MPDSATAPGSSRGVPRTPYSPEPWILSFPQFWNSALLNTSKTFNLYSPSLLKLGFLPNCSSLEISHFNPSSVEVRKYFCSRQCGHVARVAIGPGRELLRILPVPGSGQPPPFPLAAVMDPEEPPAACLSLHPAVPCRAPLIPSHPAWHTLHTPPSGRLGPALCPLTGNTQFLSQPPHLLLPGLLLTLPPSPGSTPITDLSGTCPCSVPSLVVLQGQAQPHTHWFPQAQLYHGGNLSLL